MVSDKLLSQQLVDERRVGLTAGCFHDLADKKAQHLWVGRVLRDLCRAGSQRSVDRGLDRSGVADLPQPFCFDCFRSSKPQLPLAEQSVFSGLVVPRVAPAN